MWIDERVVERLYRTSDAERWSVSRDRFASALQASASRACQSTASAPADVERCLASLHLKDLALACACADGQEDAWEHFIREHRPVLYRAADAIDPAGGAREIADSIYGELFGLKERDGGRVSLFRYFHGRSSLATWLRSVLAQRFVDRVRAGRRLDPLPDDEGSIAGVSPSSDVAPRARYLSVMRRTVKAAVERLAARDRLRLGCYYAQGLTLAEVGRILREHEATVSRHLARTRRAIRADVEVQLRRDERMSDAEVADCLASVVEDPGPLDLAEMLDGASVRKNPGWERSE